MKTYAHSWSYLVEFFLESQMLETKVIEKMKTHILCGNKIPTRCNRDFYCRSYCLLNMFRATLCPQILCGNKMPTRCNRGFYCRSYCLHDMFRAPLCPSSGAQEYYTVVAACCISCCGFQVVGLVWS